MSRFSPHADIPPDPWCPAPSQDGIINMVVGTGSAPFPPRAGCAGGGGEGTGGGGGGCAAGGGGGGGCWGAGAGAAEEGGTMTVVNTVAVAVPLAAAGGGGGALGRTALASGIEAATPPATVRPGMLAGAAAAALK